MESAEDHIATRRRVATTPLYQTRPPRICWARSMPPKAMTPAQRDAAFALLKTGLSASGFSRAETIRGLENVLREAEKSDRRDPELYFVTVFGSPDDATWAWRYEGHHLAARGVLT